MPRLPLVPLLLLALALPAPVLAADERDRRRAALLLVESAAPDSLIRTLAQAPVQQLLAATHEVQPDLSGPDMMVLSALYYEEMHHAALSALSQRASAIANRYSLAELEALRSFAATEDGAAALAREAELTGNLARSIEDAMLNRMDAAFDRYGRGG
jgi:hypothetical protein